MYSVLLDACDSIGRGGVNMYFIIFTAVTLQIEMLYSTEIIEEKAILLAVRPLQIGHRKTTKRFLEYKPPIE